MSISVKELSKVYGTQRAVDSISFTANPGEVVGFLGPNGAGKSTTMKILAGYIPQSEGKATVCGLDVETQAIEVRRLVGYLPESNPLYTDLYIKEYLSMMGRLQGMVRTATRVKEMIELTGLSAEQHKKIGQLSRGYRQRVGIAAALIHNPQVVIMDEPTSGLDPNQVVEIRALIKSMGENKTVLMSTHILSEVESICSRAIIINKGKIVADDTITHLKSTFSQTFYITIQFKENINIKSLFDIPGVTNVVQIPGNGFQVTSQTDLRDALFKYAVAHNFTILSLQTEAGSLEDVFRTLTK